MASLDIMETSGNNSGINNQNVEESLVVQHTILGRYLSAIETPEDENTAVVGWIMKFSARFREIWENDGDHNISHIESKLYSLVH